MALCDVACKDMHQVKRFTSHWQLRCAFFQIPPQIYQIRDSYNNLTLKRSTQNSVYAAVSRGYLTLHLQLLRPRSRILSKLSPPPPKKTMTIWYRFFIQKFTFGWKDLKKKIKSKWEGRGNKSKVFERACMHVERRPSCQNMRVQIPNEFYVRYSLSARTTMNPAF